MGKPVDPAGLLAGAEREYERLGERLAAFPADRLTDVAWQADIEDQSRNPRDVVTHVHEWQVMTLAWYEIGMAGGKPAIPGEGLTWRETPVVNARIWDRYKDTPYQQAVELLAGTHRRCLEVIASHTDEELFTKRRYAWTGSTSVGAYFTSATWSHYQWAQRTLKAIAKTL